MVDFAAARLNMVESQIRTNKVTDARLIEAMEAIPREDFVPEARRSLAYIDEDLKIADGRYLMEPMVLARLLQAANPGAEDIALDIACGPGYSTAVLARLCATVVALEDDEKLTEESNNRLNDAGIDNAVVVKGNLIEGYAKQGPYDIILIGGAVQSIPEAIPSQLNVGGRLVAVVLDESGLGRATLIERQDEFLSERVLFDASVPRLDAFDLAPGFTF
ncbi:MAG: protein-L-isoaspartate O-methyltransferase [Pseudomonadota bacterium]